MCGVLMDYGEKKGDKTKQFVAINNFFFFFFVVQRFFFAPNWSFGTNIRGFYLHLRLYLNKFKFIGQFTLLHLATQLVMFLLTASWKSDGSKHCNVNQM